MSFTDKQRAFIEEYPKDFNATRAAIRSGYSEKTAYSIGHENLKKPEIAAEIQKKIDEIAMTAEEVLIRLAEQARGEHSAYLTPDGVDLTRLLEDGKGHLVKSIKETGYGKNVEFYDAQSALSLIGKHHGLFVDRHEYTGKDGEPIRVTLTDD